MGSVSTINGHIDEDLQAEHADYIFTFCTMDIEDLINVDVLSFEDWKEKREASKAGKRLKSGTPEERKEASRVLNNYKKTQNDIRRNNEKQK